jgi:uncharacterized membrane protein
MADTAWCLVGTQDAYACVTLARAKRFVGFLAGLPLAAPLTGATVGTLLGSAGTAAATCAGIKEDFIHEVEAMMKPGTSALFLLDVVGDMEVILHKIRGLGGMVLKTNVDLERAKLIQSTLAGALPD